MDVNTESRLFDVVDVADSADDHGYHAVTLGFGEHRFSARCKPDDRPTIGKETVRVFYREGTLDFAFEGLYDVTEVK